MPSSLIRDLPKHPMTKQALALYVDWLNMWQADDDVSDHRYTVNDFMHPEWRSPLYEAVRAEDGLYPRSTEVVARLELTDGDEGGPQVLWVRCTRQRNPDSVIIHSIVQEFDTRWTHIYEDGGFLNVPPTKPVQS